MSGRTARTIRNFSLELWQVLVLHGIGKSTFQHLTVNWNLKVLEMALKTIHFVQGLSRTPLLFIPRYITNIFFKHILQQQKISRIGNLKICKSKNPGSLTGAQILGELAGLGREKVRLEQIHILPVVFKHAFIREAARIGIHGVHG